jgi:hypothetical protein
VRTRDATPVVVVSAVPSRGRGNRGADAAALAWGHATLHRHVVASAVPSRESARPAPGQRTVHRPCCKVAGRVATKRA